MPTNDTLEALAARVEAFNARVERIVAGDDDLSPQGAAIAMALLVTTNFSTLQAIPAALRAKAKDEQPRKDNP